MHSDRTDRSTRRWYKGASPLSTGRFFGALAGVGFVLPFIGATFLEKGVGDSWTIAILAVLIGIFALIALVLFVRGRWVEGLLFVPLTVGLSLALWITATMDW